MIILLAAALLHWQRTRHWCLLAMAIGAFLIAVGATGIQIIQPQIHPEKLASGAVAYNIRPLIIWMSLQTAGAGVAAMGGIGAIHWAIQLRRPPEARITDPIFGELQRFADSSWTGEIMFSPTQQRVSISIDAPRKGPTDEQRSLFKRIEEKYAELLPEISKSLAAYVKEDWQFELCDIEIPADPQSDKWTGQYERTGEEEVLGYFVDVVDWKVVGVTGVN
jgi:hypothetical protein